MNIQVILLLVLCASIFILFLQCMIQFGLKLDAGLVFGFSIFFEFIGYTYKLYAPGSPLHLLWALPLIPVIIAVFYKQRASWDILQDQGIWLWLIFLFYSITSIIWASSYGYGFTKEKILIIHGVIPGIYTYMVYRRYQTFSWSIVVSIGMLYSLFHLVFGTFTMEYPGRLTLPGGNPIYDARMSLLVVAIALWGKNIPVWLRIAAIAVSAVSALATQSRGPIAAFAAANVLVVLYILFRKYKNGQLTINKTIIKTIAAICLLIGVCTLVFSNQLVKLVGDSRYAVFVDSNQMKEDANYTGRKDLLEVAFHRFVENPFLGTGLGGDTPSADHEFPHNIVLEMASELGLLGISFWVMAFAASLYAAQRNGLLLVLLIQTFAYALSSGDFGFNYEYVLVSITALALYKKGNSEGLEGVRIHEKSRLSTDLI
jgi:O-antigen ligase